MYIVAGADNLDGVQLFIVGAYKTIEEANQVMLETVKNDMIYELDDMLDPLHREDILNKMIRDGDLIDYCENQYINYGRRNYGDIKYIIHKI